MTVTVEDLGDVGAEVPIKLIGEGGDVTKRLQVPARGKASVRIELPSVPQQIVVNDGSVPENNLANNTFKISVPTAP